MKRSFTDILKQGIPLDLKVAGANLLKYGSLTPDTINRVTLTFNLFEVCNCLFIHIPKTGGMSVYKALFEVESLGHRSLRDYYLAYGKIRVNKRFKFCFVRNPYSRIKSAYLYILRGGRQRSFDFNYQQIIQKANSFEDFVLNWLHKPEIFEMEHFRPQTYYITDFDNKIRMDFIGRFENLNEDFQELAKVLNAPTLKIPDLNKSDKDRKDNLPDNDSIRNKIYYLYEVDFKNFGYDK